MPLADGRRHLLPRVAALRRWLAERELDALLVTSLPNIFYLTNFSGTAAFLLVSAKSAALLTDARYVGTVAALLRSPAACPGLRLVRVDAASGTYEETLAAVVRARKVRRLGFEAAHLSVRRWEWLRTALPETTLVPTDGLVEGGRAVKDDFEIRTLREAARRLAAVVPTVLEEVGEGRAERDVAARIDGIVRQAGFDRLAFDTIVASGPNSAVPHARPTARRLARGDLVVLDFGGVYDGYCVDLTRVAAVGKATPESRRLYKAVVSAHQAALAAVAPGVPAGDVDSAARRALEEHGLAEAFTHSTGHGLGIEVHEEPRIARRSTASSGHPPAANPGAKPGVTPGADRRLEAGMVFTIEPGVYLPGIGGVRLEDDILVTPGGAEVLTGACARTIAVR